MANDGRIFDGHTFVFGMDADTDPSILEASLVSKAVNRVFRGGNNRTRPPFVHKQFIFDDDSIPYMNVVLYGNVQGAYPYQRTAPGREDGMVVSIAGHLFFMTLVNDRFIVRLIWKGNKASLTHCWMEQAAEWMYIQDGDQPPVFWNGLYPSTARRSLGTPGQEMPIGTIMKYIHGRMWVSNAFDQIAASDIMYGAGFTNTANVQKFTENTYWAEGGYFGTPANLGQITGMLVMPRIYKGGLRGQGELLVMCMNGAQVIEAGSPRAQWKDEQIQSVSLTGRGGISPYALINVNNDAFFRSDDGMASYRLSMSEAQRDYSFSKISSPVNNWFDADTAAHIQFCSAIYFDNRVIMTVNPYVERAIDPAHGVHRYFRGMVALDLDKKRNVPGDQDYNWDGLWTGIRPTVLIKTRLGTTVRAFAISHDDDGVNRIYEIMRHGHTDRIDGQNIKTKWFYITKKFGWLPSGASNEFEVKRLVGGEVWISDVHHRVKIRVDYRPDKAEGWYQTMNWREFGSELGFDWTFSQSRYRRFKFDSPQLGCLPGAPYILPHGACHQIKVEGEGAVQIDRLRVAMAANNDPNSLVGSCNEPVDDPKTTLDSIPENDYSYSIAGSRQ